MNRYFIHLSFRGTNYQGWQVQPGKDTVQQRLNDALSTFLRENISTIGAGRTDSGVHARKFFAHFDCKNTLTDVNDTIYHVNHILPRDIAVHAIQQVHNDAHARFDAKSRTYEYYVTTSKDPFSVDFKYHIEYEIDIKKMDESAKILLDYQDFKSFCKSNSDVKTHFCHIKQAFWQQNENDFVFTITADRFLRNMVRAIVGTLLDIGKEKIDCEQFKHIIEQKDRRYAGYSAPAKGLCLTDIRY
jgi:tRNA pseudouridine38-40 synthase